MLDTCHKAAAAARHLLDELLGPGLSPRVRSALTAETESMSLYRCCIKEMPAPFGSMETLHTQYLSQTTCLGLVQVSPFRLIPPCLTAPVRSMGLQHLRQVSWPGPPRTP